MPPKPRPRKTPTTTVTVEAAAPSQPVKRRSRRRRTAKLATIKAANSLPTTVVHVAPPRTKRDRLARRRNKQLPEGARKFSALAKYMAPGSYNLLKSMISPAETPAPQGFPDRTVTSSFVMNKMMPISISRPSTFKANSWSAVWLQLSSPEIAGLVFLYDGTIGPDSYIPWNQHGTIPGWEHYPVRWSDVTNVLSPTVIDERLAKDVNQPYYCSLRAVQSDKEDNDHAVFPTVETTWHQNIKTYRCLGASTTLQPVVNVTNLQGTVYSTRFEQAFERRPVNMTASAQCKDKGSLLCSGDVQSWVLPTISTTLQGMMNDTTQCYMGQFADGSYTIMPPRRSPKWLAADVDRAVLTFEDDINDRPEGDFPAFYADFFEGYYDKGSKYATPIGLTIDPSYNPTIVLATGLAENAICRLKVIAHFECTPNPSGHFAFMSKAAPQKDSNFIDILEAVSGLIPFGAPASANDFWSVLKDIGSELWTVLKGAIPGLIAKILV